MPTKQTQTLTSSLVFDSIFMLCMWQHGLVVMCLLVLINTVALR